MRNLNPNHSNLLTDHRFIVILLAFFAFAMSAILSRTVFERLPHLEDEVAYLYQARIFAQGDVIIESPDPRRAFWQPFIVDRDGNRFSKYTPGWSAQLALGLLMGEAWVINAFFAMLTVAVTYRFAREIFNAETGLIAAALVAFSPMALLLNATLMAHSAALFWTTLFMYAYWRLERGRRALLWGLIGGLALGMLIASRPLTGLAVALPLVVWSGIRLVRAIAAKIRTEVKGLRTEEGIETLGESTRVSSETGEANRNPTLNMHSSLSPFTSVLSPSLRPQSFFAVLRPLIALGLLAVILGASVPLYNRAAVGDPFSDLYRLVWDYDRVGFGQGYGRNGHTLQKAFNHGRFDLSLTAADLFGWQVGTITDAEGEVYADVVTQLTTEGDYWLRFGLSWLLIPFGLIIAYRRRSVWVALWFAILFGWMRFAFDFQNGAQMTNPFFAWIWMAVAFAWLFAPFLLLRRRVEVWTWILVAVTLSLLGAQMTYWIGAQRYSTRYYYEALTSVAIISALPVAWLVRKFVPQISFQKQPHPPTPSPKSERGSKPTIVIPTRRRWLLQPIVYGVFVGVMLYSFYAYSLPRITVLNGFNNVSRQLISDVEARRNGDQPVLVIINGSDVRWRAFGSLMAVTSPYLDSPIVAAWNFQDTNAMRDQIIARFPDRQIIDMEAQEAQAWFTETVSLPP